MAFPRVIQEFLEKHAPELLEEKGLNPPATLVAPAASPVKPEALKQKIKTNFEKIEKDILDAMWVMTQIENSKYASEMNRLGLVFLQKARNEINKHQAWMKDK